MEFIILDGNDLKFEMRTLMCSSSLLLYLINKNVITRNVFHVLYVIQKSYFLSYSVILLSISLSCNHIFSDTFLSRTRENVFLVCPLAIVTVLQKYILGSGSLPARKISLKNWGVWVVFWKQPHKPTLYKRKE